MTLVSSIIRRAYRVSNLFPIGADPTSGESDEALDHLQSIIESMLGNEAGEQLSSFPIGNNNVSQPDDWVPDPPDYLPSNVRLVCNIAGATTLYLDPDPQDGARLAVIDASANFATYNLTLNGNGRKVDGGTTDVLSTNSQAIQYFYRDDLADWKVISTLATSDQMPFPVEFDILFIVLLGMMLNPSNSQSIAQELVDHMERSRERFRARYTQTVPTPADLAVLNLGRVTHSRRSNINVDF